MPKSRSNAEAAPLAPEDNELEELRALFADLTNRRQRAFLAGFIVGKGLKRAAELSGLSRWCHYEWMRVDALYRERFKLARQILVDDAEGEAYRRAVHGVDQPIVFRGKITGAAKSRSDALLVFVLKAMRPEIYRDGAEPEPDLNAPPLKITIEKHEQAGAEQPAAGGTGQSMAPDSTLPRASDGAEAGREEPNASASAAAEYEERALGAVRGKV